MGAHQGTAAQAAAARFLSLTVVKGEESDELDVNDLWAERTTFCASSSDNSAGGFHRNIWTRLVSELPIAVGDAHACLGRRYAITRKKVFFRVWRGWKIETDVKEAENA